VEASTDVDGDGSTGLDGTNDGGVVYGSIGAGVENASTGDRVVVEAGTYLENDITVSDRIGLVADRTVTVDGNGLFGPGIVIEAGGAVVEGFVAVPVGGNGIAVTQGDVSGRTVRLRNVSPTSTGNRGVDLAGTSVDDTAVLADVTVAGTDSGPGVVVDDFETPRLTTVTVTGASGSFGGDGVRIVDASGGVLANATADGKAAPASNSGASTGSPSTTVR